MGARASRLRSCAAALVLTLMSSPASATANPSEGATADPAVVVMPVADIEPGGSSYPSGFTEFKGALYFATKVTRGLWRTDLTTTQRIADLEVKPQFTDPEFAVVGDQLFFSAIGGNYGRELWVTDGTAEGTRLVANINPTTSSDPAILTAFGEHVYFSATDGTVSGTELWRSNGTTTERVVDLVPGPDDSAPMALTVHDRHLYFIAGPSGTRQLWRTDGTSTTAVADAAWAPSSRSGALVWLGEHLYFQRSGALWRTDGTPDGAEQVATLSASTGGVGMVELVRTGDRVMWAVQGQTAQEIWSTDGTTTTMLGRFGGNEIPVASGFTAFGDRVYFGATRDHGNELWSTDGTSVVELTDLNPGTKNSWPGAMKSFGGGLYFGANDAAGKYSLWRTDGTTVTKVVAAGGTYPLYPANLTVFRSGVVFSAFGTDGTEVWRLGRQVPATIAVTRPAQGAKYQYAEDLWAEYSCTAAVDGFELTSCTGSSQRADNSPGQHSYTVTATDRSGFVTTSTVTYTVLPPPGQTPPPPAPPSCGRWKATIVAPKGGGTIRGTNGRDVIVGSSGRDVIRARGGHDIVCAGGGADDIDGGQGDDRLYGGGGNDRVAGGAGRDYVLGEDGRDHLDGGSGDRDVCGGGHGRTTIRNCP